LLKYEKLVGFWQRRQSGGMVHLAFETAEKRE
jgi:hypothetical protein